MVVVDGFWQRAEEMKSIKAASGLEVKKCILNEMVFPPVVLTDKKRHLGVNTRS